MGYIPRPKKTSFPGDDDDGGVGGDGGGDYDEDRGGVSNGDYASFLQ